MFFRQVLLGFLSCLGLSPPEPVPLAQQRRFDGGELRAAAAVGLTLELVDQCLGHHLLPLPYANNPLAQLGLMFGLAYLLVEIEALISDVLHWLQKLRRRTSQSRRPKDSPNPKTEP
jgi:hypothetical protein